MSHTPGPWEWENHPEEPNHFTIEAEMVGRIGVVADTLNRDCVIDPDEDHANARLIAAAPELLEACEAIELAWINRPVGSVMMPEWCEAVGLVRNAISKAKGQTP